MSFIGQAGTEAPPPVVGPTEEEIAAKDRAARRKSFLESQQRRGRSASILAGNLGNDELGTISRPELGG